MLLPDVNVLVAAYRTDHPQHRGARSWLEEAVDAVEPLGLTDSVLGGVVRVLTHPRIFTTPTPAAQVFEQLDALRGATRLVRPGRGWWSVFRTLCAQADARGSLVADAAHAATAIEAGATWVTFDRDFARFQGLRWRTP